MAENADGQEKTEQPTPQKIKKAREDGNVPRSKELAATALLLAAGLGGLVFGESFVSSMQNLFISAFTFTKEDAFDPQKMAPLLVSGLYHSFITLSPFLGLLLIVVLMTPMSIGGWNFSFKALAFKGNRLDPIKGIGKMFSMNSLVELVKAIAKFTLVAAVSIFVMYVSSDHIGSLISMDVKKSIAESGYIVMWSFLFMASSMILITVIDVPFQLYNYTKNLKMTLKEVKDELKNTEGDPHVKAKIKQVQAQMSQNRMMSEVAEADFIITNPTHYAVAVKYDLQKSEAPFVVAKGLNHVAEKIKELGRENMVPIVSAPALARAIYHHTNINQNIPMGLYQSVAQIMAYVYQLNSFMEQGVKNFYEEPQAPTESELFVPKDLWVDPPE